jgi:hypothetical protein
MMVIVVMTTMISGGGWMSRATRVRARRVSNGRVGQTSPGLVQRSRARVEGGARPTCRPTANVGPGHVTRSQVRVVGRARPRAPIPRCPLLSLSARGFSRRRCLARPICCARENFCATGSDELSASKRTARSRALASLSSKIGMLFFLFFHASSKWIACYGTATSSRYMFRRLKPVCHDILLDKLVGSKTTRTPTSQQPAIVVWSGPKRERRAHLPYYPYVS